MKDNNTLYTFALLALLTLSAYFLADTVDAMIGRSSVLERGLFGEGKAPATAGQAAPTVQYKLIGTVEGDAFAGAVLEDSAGQVFYRIQQRMPDGSTIVKVQKDRISIKLPDGSIVGLQVVDDAKIVPVQPKNGDSVKRLSDGRFMVDQKEVLASTENMGQILTQARALPYQEQGKTVGFRISEITSGSIYEKIGLQNGDVIQRVNAQDVDDPAKFFQLYQGLRNERNITIDLIRGGQRQTLNYEIR